MDVGEWMDMGVWMDGWTDEWVMDTDKWTDTMDG